MSTDVLLIPPVINPFFEENRRNFMPLGILALTSVIKKEGFSVEIYKPHYRLIKSQDFVNTAKDILINRPKVIGFSTWCITYPASILLAEQIKRLNKEVVIIFGGPQASILPIETLTTFPFIDFVLSGEADITFPLFLTEIFKNNSFQDLSKINGLSFRNWNGETIKIEQNRAFFNLDELPIPSFELIPKTNILNLDVGRGCPYKCTFCSTNSFFSKYYRIKSTERIINEMNYAFHKLKIKTFSFNHDILTLDKKKIHQLCTELIKLKEINGLDFIWTCSARIDSVDKDMLHQMQKAGCTSIFFGIESGSEKIQKSIHKNLHILTAFEVADYCREIGINMHVSFILGFPEETTDDLELTLQTIIKLIFKGAVVQSSELTLLPGTQLYKQYNDQLRFDCSFSNFSYTFCGVEEVQLITKYPEIFSSFYYLPVSSIDRKEILFLNGLINGSSDFRNTLFLLRKLILTDIQNLNLLHLYKKVHPELRKNQNGSKLVVSIWIDFLKNYLRKNTNRIEFQFIYDVFAYEAFTALLKIRYSGWQLITPQKSNLNFRKDLIIKQKPVWKILHTFYNLNEILPSENLWQTENIMKYSYKMNYLLIALTEQNTTFIKLNESDEFLLNNLEDQPVSDFLKKTEKQYSKKISSNFLKKMERLGVLYFEEALNY